jgi:hypothetical protein
MTNEHVLRTQQLVEVTRMFKRVASAQDDIAAMDELKRCALHFRAKGLFSSTLHASQFLAALNIDQVIFEPATIQALHAAKLSTEDVQAAQVCATRFVCTVGA